MLTMLADTKIILHYNFTASLKETHTSHMFLGIFRANQETGFSMIWTSVLKELMSLSVLLLTNAIIFLSCDLDFHHHHHHYH